MPTGTLTFLSQGCFIAAGMFELYMGNPFGACFFGLVMIAMAITTIGLLHLHK